MALRIKEVIKDQETTVQEFADKIEISKAELTNCYPSTEILEQTASALNVQVPDLFEKSTDEVVENI